MTRWPTDVGRGSIRPSLGTWNLSNEGSQGLHHAVVCATGDESGFAGWRSRWVRVLRWGFELASGEGQRVPSE